MKDMITMVSVGCIVVAVAMEDMITMVSVAVEALW